MVWKLQFVAPTGFTTRLPTLQLVIFGIYLDLLERNSALSNRWKPIIFRHTMDETMVFTIKSINRHRFSPWNPWQFHIVWPIKPKKNMGKTRVFAMIPIKSICFHHGIHGFSTLPWISTASKSPKFSTAFSSVLESLVIFLSHGMKGKFIGKMVV